MKRYLFHLAFPLLVVFIPVLNVTGQNSLVNYTVYEKVYLHIDREVYAPGEDIWFKVYLVSGINNRLLSGYKNVYVQLVNDSGLVVFHRLILVKNGVANGDFRLPARMQQGAYTVRAFTKYLKDFEEESLFHKRVWILHQRKKQLSIKNFNRDSIDVGFYPDGGNLVLNASNQVAFKAIDSEGRGINVSGFIVNDLGDTITPFATEFLGMGRVSLMPQSGRTYYAILNGHPSFRKKFRNVQEYGLVLQVRNDPDKIILGLSRNFNHASEDTFVIYGSQKGTGLFETTVKVEKFFEEIELSKELFPLGISKLTVSDSNGLILAERLVFIDTGGPPVLDIVVSGEKYDARSKVDLEIRADLEAGDSLQGGLSVAVINRDYLDRDGYQSNIKSYLLLDSELKGPIESSASFFENSGRLSSAEKLDLLMMVHGWRSYYWPDVIENEPEDLAGWADVGLSIEGRVKRLFREKPIEDSKVILGPYSRGLMFEETTTNEDGEFSFDRLFLLDSSELILQAKTPSGTDRTEILIDHFYEPEIFTDPQRLNEVVSQTSVPGSYFGEHFSRLEAERKYAIESGSHWLEAVEIITQERESVLDLTEEAQRTYGTPQRRFTISEDDQTYLNIYDYLEGKVPGVMVDGNTISIRGGLTPTVMLDGVVNDLVDIGTIPMGDIDHIDLFYSGAQMAAFGYRGGDGIIAIYTKMGSIDTDFKRYIRGRTTRIVDGFQVPRIFYSPKYSWEDLDSKAPDYRATLHWEPYATFKDGACKLEFFTSDFRNKYLVIVEGISDNGVICSGTGEFTVE